jgi:ATP-dependent DNA ligase
MVRASRSKGGPDVKEPKRRRISRAAAMAGARNLERWRASQDADAAEVREMTAAFEKELRAEIGENTSAIASALARSAVASYHTVCLVSLKITKGLGRLDRVKELHSLLVEAQRVLHRNLKALLAWKESPEARAAALRRITATIPTLTEEDRVAQEEAATKRLEENKARFACLEEGYDGPPPPNEHH